MQNAECKMQNYTAEAEDKTVFQELMQNDDSSVTAEAATAYPTGDGNMEENA